MAGGDGDPFVVEEGVEDEVLLGPEVFAEALGDEGGGVVLVVGPCAGVGVEVVEGFGGGFVEEGFGLLGGEGLEVFVLFMGGEVVEVFRGGGW